MSLSAIISRRAVVVTLATALSLAAFSISTPVSAQEAIKQSSLDRVRGEIASMRTADDLSRITPVVWHELTALGVPFFRCGVSRHKVSSWFFGNLSTIIFLVLFAQTVLIM